MIKQMQAANARQNTIDNLKESMCVACHRAANVFDYQDDDEQPVIVQEIAPIGVWKGGC